MTPEEITALCESLGEKPYRGRQVFEAVYGGADIAGMTTLS